MGKIQFHSFDTVSDQELAKLMLNQKFVNFFRSLDSLADGNYFPAHWLITSIDRFASNGKLRYEIERGNHHNSNAVDIVPIGDDGMIRLPIPLNRNLLMMRLFRTYFDKVKARGFDLPIIVFEADHIHCDVNHRYDVCYLNETRIFCDMDVHKAANHYGVLRDAINNHTLIRL